MRLDVKIRNGRRLALGRRDFVASGGQAQVFARNGMAFKVFHERSQVPSLAKLAELGAIVGDAVVKPSELLLDAGSGEPIGCVMPFVSGADPLATVVPSAYQRHHGLGMTELVRIALAIRQAVATAHAAGVVVVDLNDMNVLVEPQRRAVRLIDADSYQTPSFPADALDPAVRDWHGGSGFDELSDWFAFAVLSFALFVGIHPYRGQHPKVRGLEARMRANLSVFDKHVRLPPACRPIAGIPPVWRDWYRAVFEDGERTVPPADGSPVHAAEPRVAGGSGPVRQPDPRHGHANLTLVPLQRGGATILEYAERQGLTVVVRATGIEVNGRVCAVAPGAPRLRDVAIAWTRPGGRPVLAAVAGGRLMLTELDSGETIRTTLAAEALNAHEGSLYVRTGESVVRVCLHDAGDRLVAASDGVAARILPHAAKLFPGAAIQNLLGACHVTLFGAGRSAWQIPVPELDGQHVIAARYRGGVLMCVTARRLTYRRLVLRFDAAHRRYDVRTEKGVSAGLPSFVTLPGTTTSGGLCVALDGAGRLELFAARMDAGSTTIVADPRLHGDARLVAHDGGVALIRGDSVQALHYRASSAA